MSRPLWILILLKAFGIQIIIKKKKSEAVRGEGVWIEKRKDVNSYRGLKVERRANNLIGACNEKPRAYEGAGLEVKEEKVVKELSLEVYPIKCGKFRYREWNDNERATNDGRGWRRVYGGNCVKWRILKEIALGVRY